LLVYPACILCSRAMSLPFFKSCSLFATNWNLLSRKKNGSNSNPNWQTGQIPCSQSCIKTVDKTWKELFSIFAGDGCCSLGNGILPRTAHRQKIYSLHRPQTTLIFGNTAH
jgi:hypothetical protein